jgi:hypothetical protein
MTTNGAALWTAGALLYSGRPDPSWIVEPISAAELAERYEQLAPLDRKRPEQTRLGYRGVWLRAPNGRRWMAFEGAVWRDDDTRMKQPVTDTRRDPGGKWERALLATAPPSTLPEPLRNLR